MGKSSFELSPRITTSSRFWCFQILSTSLTILGVDFIIPLGGEKELEGSLGEWWPVGSLGLFCVGLLSSLMTSLGSLSSFMKSFGLADVTVSNGGVPGESDSMCIIFTVGENFSLFLLMLVKLWLSEELEYRSCLDFPHYLSSVVVQPP